MKKNILILLPVLSFFCLLTGCSGQEDENLGYVDNRVRIAVKIGTTTRGEGMINPGSKDLPVGLIRLDEGDTDYSKEQVIDGTIDSGNKTLQIANPLTTDAYYPANKNQLVRLIGWYPKEGTFNASNGKVTIPIDGSTDIMYTKMAEGTSGTGFTNGITFEHALTQITVTAVYANAPAKTKWKGITSITILNKKQDCILTLPVGVGNDLGISFSENRNNLPLVQKNPVNNANINYGQDNPLSINVGSENAVTCGYAMFAPDEGLTIEVTIKSETNSLSTTTIPISHRFKAEKTIVIPLTLTEEGVSIE